MDYFRTWDQFETWLDSRGLFHIDLSLNRIRTVLEKLPEPAYLAAQVLGTNGKGSTCAFLTALAMAHGLKTGLFISPHFVSVKERIQINGSQLDNAVWLEAANLLLAIPEASGLTYFEFLACLAVIIFSAHGVEFAVFEAGLGGRYDATSALPIDIHCFASIALDHADIIGPKIDDIAADKAAAIQPRSRVFTVRQYPAAMAAILRKAKLAGCKVIITDALDQETKLMPSMRGHFQLFNSRLALSAWRAIAALKGINSNYEAAGITSAFMPGRMQKIPAAASHGEFILDGAHNPHATQILLDSLDDSFSGIIYSALADKNWQASLGMLLRLRLPITIVQLSGPRAANASDMAAWANARFPGSAKVASSMQEILHAYPKALMCGSLYLLAEFYKLFPRYLQREIE